MRDLIVLLIVWRMVKKFMQRHDRKEIMTAMLKVCGMWVLGIGWFVAFVWFDSNVSQGYLAVWIFGTLWLPIRWDRHMPKGLIESSWADEHEIKAM